MAALSSPVAGEGVRRGRALFRPRSGEQGRGANDRGRRAGLLGQLARVGRSPSGAGAFSFCFFVLFVLLSFFVISFLLFICFSVLFQFNLFRHFIKICFL